MVLKINLYVFLRSSVFKQAVYRRGKKLNKSKTQKQSEEEHDYYYYQKKKISNLWNNNYIKEWE